MPREGRPTQQASLSRVDVGGGHALVLSRLLPRLGDWSPAVCTALFSPVYVTGSKASSIGATWPCLLISKTGKSTPVNQLGSADFTEPPDPFQPLGADSSDPFQNKKGFGDPFSGKDPFAPSSSAKPSKASSLGFADFTSFGNEEQQLAWAKRESEKAEQERLARLRRQEQEDLELAIALSKADMPAA
ncbi:hypothetical protein E5288_WYG021092 [Bos mutus]|uniref:Epidermal growth factor receptor substrate 15-like 1 n=1 Tax=Bos mutus TaxID=72004 RepID=A0A6B0RV62_9CETA|nr:hypothetical protein [Bos mutus]